MAQHHVTEADLSRLASGQHPMVSALIEEGRFPEGWAADYCAFLGGSTADAVALWPWQLFQAVHFVSFHLWFRYAAWRSFNNKSNLETEYLLGQVQLESELFLWNSACGVPRLSEPDDRARELGIDERDATLVKLCFDENVILRGADGADDSVVEAWRQQYRTALSGISMKWQLRPYLWKWLALAVRFASFYLDLAMIPREVQLRCDDQRGLEPSRIQETLQRLQAHIPNQAVIGIVDLWLRLAHLRRDASGMPSVLSSVMPTSRSVGVRTASELFLQADSGS